MISNAHVHTQFCDGKSSAEEIALEAIKREFRAIGFTSHGVQDFDEIFRSNPCFLPSFLSV